MPQLPSGLHVALSVDRFRASLESGDFGARLAFDVEAQEPRDLLPVINIVQFRPWPDGGAGREGLAALGEPVVAEFMLGDVGTARCPWSDEDQQFLMAWLQAPRSREWLQATYDELLELASRVKVVLPEALKGIFD